MKVVGEDDPFLVSACVKKAVTNEHTTHAEKRCQSIFWNIIEDSIPTTTKDDTSVASVKFYARVNNFMRCSKLAGHDELRDVAEGLKRKCNEYKKDASDNLLQKTHIDDMDERAAMYALQEYRHDMTDACARHLTWGGWLYYQTVFKGERALAALGLGGILWKARHTPQYMMNTAAWIKRDRPQK